MTEAPNQVMLPFMSVLSRLRRRTGATPPAASAPSRRPPVDASSAPVGLLLGGAAFVLIFMVTALAIFSIERNDTAMARLLAEKGSSLIMAFESILRTTMRSEAGVRLQVLLEEMTVSRDIQFIAVTMPDGTIVAHSNPDRLGEILMLDGEEISPERLRAMAPGMDAQWGIMAMEGRRAFVVYRVFMPSPSLAASGLPAPTIFLGLDISPFDITRRQDRDYVVMLAGVMLLVGLAILVALYYAQRARQSRLRQRRAEGQVRMLEEEVRRKEKLAAVGTLAAGVAHEIRNPLGIIRSSAELLQRRADKTDTGTRRILDAIYDEAVRLSQTVNDFLDYARPRKPRQDLVDVQLVLDQVLAFLEGEMKRVSVAIERGDAPGSPPWPTPIMAEKTPLWVRGDKDLLYRALYNILINGQQALDGPGILYINAWQDDDGIHIAVRDSGPGIDPALLPSLLDPFFTTKDGGTGLGLPIVNSIITSHGGRIELANAPEGGAIVRLDLPAADGDASAPETEDAGTDEK